MLENAKLYLTVREQGRDLQKQRIYILPINSEIENMKMSDLAAYLGLKYAEAVVNHNIHEDSNVSDTIISSWLNGDITVAQFTFSSLFAAIAQNNRMKGRVSTDPEFFSDPAKQQSTLVKLQQREDAALQVLSKVLDGKTIETACERIRTFNSSTQVYDLTNELGILQPKEQKNEAKM